MVESEVSVPETTPPTPKPKPEPAPPPNRVAILLSDDIPAYTATANELRKRIAGGQHTTYSLHGQAANAEQVMSDINSSSANRLVAIGTLAARTARGATDLPMVFCQVFNHAEHDLVSAKSRGVSLVPPFSMQLEVWKAISPDLGRVGVITGPGHENLVARATLSAEEQKVELISRVVNSDKEALYVFKRMVPQIDGLWLLPDNRILSPRVIGEIMAYSEKHGKQVLAFSPSLLGMGALLSVTAQDGDVADQVMALLEDADDRRGMTGAAMTELTEMVIEINPQAAEELELIVPQTLALYLQKRDR